MMIEKYISALLYRYQCVIVPGFGAFLTEIQSARYQASQQTFFPPKKSVSFNAQLTHNDGLLANHIATQEKITYDKAVSLIAQGVEQWKRVLNKQGTVDLTAIGTVISNTEGNWVFEPQASTNYLSSSFGLAAVVAPLTARSTPSAKVIRLDQPKSKGYGLFKYAAAFVITSSIAGMIYRQEHDAYVAEQTTAVEKSVQERVNNEIQQATFFIEKPLTPVTLTVKEEKLVKPYHIVASAFKSEANASKAAKELAEKGFESSYLDKNKYGLRPVLYGSYSSLNEAQQALRAIHKKHNKEAWLLIE